MTCNLKEKHTYLIEFNKCKRKKQKNYSKQVEVRNKKKTRIIIKENEEKEEKNIFLFFYE